MNAFSHVDEEKSHYFLRHKYFKLLFIIYFLLLKVLIYFLFIIHYK
jgi:hypothetical protein